MIIASVRDTYSGRRTKHLEDHATFGPRIASFRYETTQHAQPMGGSGASEDTPIPPASCCASRYLVRSGTSRLQKEIARIA